MSFDTSVIWQNLPMLLAGIWLTVAIVFLSLAVAIVIGSLVCAGTLLGRGFVYDLSVGYVALFRALPEPVIIFWLYYCGPLILNSKLSAFESGTIALAIPSGAYLAEIFRAGIQAVPRGQIEAARGIGPLLLLACLGCRGTTGAAHDDSAILGVVTILIKNSALVSAIGVEELFYRATVLGGQTFHYFEFLTVAAVVYFLMILPLSVLVQRQERRLLAKVW